MDVAAAQLPARGATLRKRVRPAVQVIEARAFGALRRVLCARAADVTASMAGRSCLVVAPHPDDEVLGCGGAMALKAKGGSRVRVVVVTDGRHSHHSAQISTDALVRMRRAESTEACARVGVPAEEVRFLEIEDGRVGQHRDRTKAQLREAILEMAPQDVLSPSPIDRHPDHRALGAIVREIVEELAEERRPRLLEYPVWFYTARAWADWRTVHRLAYAPALAAATLRPCAVDVEGVLELKRRAIAAHRSQVSNLTGEPDWFVLDPRFLRHFTRAREIYFRPRLRAAAGGAAIRVLHMLPDLAVGGGQQVLLRNIRGMDGSRVRHVVCAVRSDRAMEREFESAGVPVIRLDVRHPWQVAAAAARLAREVRRLRIDVIHTNNTGVDRLLGQLAAAATGRPLVNTIHSEYEAPARGRGVRGLVRGFARSARGTAERGLGKRTLDHAIAVSERARDTWAPVLRSAGLPDGCVRVIHPGVELSRFDPGPPPAAIAELRKGLGLENAAPVLMCVGRLVPGKGQRLLIPMLREILERWPEARLVLVGDGPDRLHLEAAASEAGVQERVRLLGSRDDVPDLLALADIVLAPSYSEGFGLTLLEAFAAGKPVVASRLRSFEEILAGDDAAVLVPPGDAGALARAVLKLLEDPSRMGFLGAAGRKVVRERFDQARTSRAVTEIYERLAAGSSAAGSAARAS